MIYYYKKENLEKGQLFVVGIEDHILTEKELIEQHKVTLYSNTVIYEGTSPFNGYPIIDSVSNTIRPATRIELIQLGLDNLIDGEYIENGEIKYIIYNPDLGYIKPSWNIDKHLWEDIATEEDKIQYEKDKITRIGEIVTNILYEVLELGFDIEVLGKSHRQSLSDSKRKALNEQITAINLATELGETIQYIPWPFKDDGTDTVVIPAEEFKKLVLESHKYGQDCYIAAEYLKDKKSTTVTMQDFLDELKKVREKRVNKV